MQNIGSCEENGIRAMWIKVLRLAQVRSAMKVSVTNKSPGDNENNDTSESMSPP